MERVFFLFRAWLKLLKFEGGNSCLWKLIFWLVELFPCPVETVFSYLQSFFLQVESIPETSEDPFFGGKTLFQLVERGFLSSENCFLLFRASFLRVKTVTETS